jgi:hypothetical protein
MVSEETFFAWLDGELDPAEAARVEAAVAADPHLATKAAEHRIMRSKLDGAFGTLVDAPMPDSILATLRSPPATEVVDFTEAKKRRTPRGWPSAGQWGSMAATLAVGIFVGTALPHQRDAGPVTVRGGKIYAAAAIGRALDAQLASAPAGDVRIGMTFRDRAGSICRSFTNAVSSGVACRANSGWQLRGLFASPPGQSNEYRMAAGMDPALASLVDSTMVGEPFDAEQEQAARQHHWK